MPDEGLRQEAFLLYRSWWRPEGIRWNARPAKVLKENNARVDSASWSAKLPAEEQEKLAEELIARGGNINFIKWEAGSVLPETGRAMEHMASFDYGYKIAAVRDWLFKQNK